MSSNLSVYVYERRVKYQQGSIQTEGGLKWGGKWLTMLEKALEEGWFWALILYRGGQLNIYLFTCTILLILMQ